VLARGPAVGRPLGRTLSGLLLAIGVPAAMALVGVLIRLRRTVPTSHAIRTLYVFGQHLTTTRRALVPAVPSALPFVRVLRVAGLDKAFRIVESPEWAADAGA